ncbi:hypothetical protein FA13DRAFT_1735328 [Coprinellus micaceus]|uniref:Uncharacterized protein n=1 Tax=Coprinellus micaceus TaxID=71717 RepID=A0A4Y7T4C8_COPMI|nr:hypothetical protein FA13DRAFT_1735328 [Coprinellus micaceus]
MKTPTRNPVRIRRLIPPQVRQDVLGCILSVFKTTYTAVTDPRLCQRRYIYTTFLAPLFDMVTEPGS